MKVFNTVKDLQHHLGSIKASPKGFVPTMGALHKGHFSLIEKSLLECPLTTVSIFVNPTQFNDKNDLERYPRTPQKDLSLLSEILRTDDAVFIPPVEEVYPAGLKIENYDFGKLDKVMEGIYRPGHFNGVAQVVSRLFDIVKPDRAYFGQKDFQQLVIVRELVRKKGLPVKIIGCPIVREPDGLAMSSRNILLEPSLREKAGIIFKTLSDASEMLKDSDIPEIKEFVASTINSTPGFKLEYFEIVDENELQPVSRKNSMLEDKKYFGCIAVWAGKIRLIDNIEFRHPYSKKVH
ncbi:MAG TPA: pantoate--beta-alanine ligase [Bacteroidales bacterium]|nr:pantoate--beta-alanine ligase [Bacteroidales bacterium]HOK73620.1 pantoate--beta-alanine ligase [Bacteroidales bacterium]HOM40589.1 pantoate--beta-alanine ligase [Bacteroidales bacterium]HOU29987.1 pantoate--beta-alanine ligase [Bacteroidales bacterium]HPP92132.1 pantoate--beta-alanine ligase [Bacteroidales bacterium]